MHIFGEIWNSKITHFVHFKQVKCIKNILKVVLSYLIDIYYLNLWNCPKMLKIKSLYRARNQKIENCYLIFQGGGIELGLYQHLSMCMLVLKLIELSQNTFRIKIKSCLREYIGIRQRYRSKSEYFLGKSEIYLWEITHFRVFCPRSQ